MHLKLNHLKDHYQANSQKEEYLQLLKVLKLIGIQKNKHFRDNLCYKIHLFPLICFHVVNNRHQG